MKALQTAVILSLFFSAGIVFGSAPLTPEELAFFETKILPVLKEECYRCHSDESGKMRGGLRLDNRLLLHIGGDSGPAVVPGNVDQSLLYQSLIYADFEMPPKKHLSEDVISDFKKWIEMGAPDPRESRVAVANSTVTDEDIKKAKENFWSYQKPVFSRPDGDGDSEWSGKSIDRYITAGLDEIGLRPPADAEPFQVLRRICFDLIGLPPTPEQVQYFGKLWDESPDKAISYVVDVLLKKEQFGERWGRHWLDAARFAESTGFSVNMTYPHAWRYRDYVIDSFNEDKPYDQFVREQVAGDLLPVDTDKKWQENLIATGFLAVGTKNVNEASARQFNTDLVDEQINATTKVFLGHSVACARCHDHKFDAITQKDYYGLAGIFASTGTLWGNPPSDMGRTNSAQQNHVSSLILLPVSDPNPYDKRYSAEEIQAMHDQIAGKQQESRELRTSGGNAQNAQRKRLAIQREIAGLKDRLAVVDKNGNPRSYCMGTQDLGKPVDAQLLVRGELDNAAGTVSRALPKVLTQGEVVIPENSSGRREVADWIADENNPLTARVMVNRIWTNLMGQGIVASPDDFGATGTAPTHPELLDYLALRFMESGWSVKEVIREIASSRIYRASSAFNEKAYEFDPDNTLLWRANPRMLDAESMRDAMLFMSGEIEPERPRGSETAKAGYQRMAESIFRMGSKEEMMSMVRQRRRDPEAEVQKPVNVTEMNDAKYRSVYLPMVRDQIPRALKVFDFPDTSMITGKRDTSNTSTQALYMMNNPFVIQQSEAFADRISLMADDPKEQIGSAFVIAFGRLPTPGEREATQAFVKEMRSQMENEELLSVLCQSLFASAEFRYID